MKMLLRPHPNCFPALCSIGRLHYAVCAVSNLEPAHFRQTGIFLANWPANEPALELRDQADEHASISWSPRVRLDAPYTFIREAEEGPNWRRNPQTIRHAGLV